MSNILLAGSLFWVWLIPYVWFAVCLLVLANKTGTPNGWFGFIPILNVYLLCKIAGHSGWWTLAIIFVPILDIIVTIWFWMEIAKRRNQPEWLGILMIIPLANLVIPGILAFGGDSG
jgi:hypothetical protein